MVQYIIIALLFIIALGFMVKKFLPSKSKQAACGKGCGCSMTVAEK